MERPFLPQPSSPREWTPDRLARLGETLDGAPLDDVLIWGLETFGHEICLATSFGPQSIVLMHRISVLRPETIVFYLDTGVLFPETYALRDELDARLGLNFTRILPELTIEEQSALHGARLWASKPDLCCELRKVLPLRRFLSDKLAWITGIRNGHSRSRAHARLVEWDPTNGAVKLNPLVHWTSHEVWNYIRDHGLPANPLHRQGFPSIGCQPCTRAVRPGEHARAGRWPGFTKTECGIHRSPAGLLHIGQELKGRAS